MWPRFCATSAPEPTGKLKTLPQSLYLEFWGFKAREKGKRITGKGKELNREVKIKKMRKKEKEEKGREKEQVKRREEKEGTL